MNTKRNLCDSCMNAKVFPVCFEKDIVFGNGVGNDNIIKCRKYQQKNVRNYWNWLRDRKKPNK